MSSPTAEQALEAMLNGPAMKPPPGVTPDFDTVPSTQAAMYAFTSVFLAFTTLAVAARTYTKAFVVKKLHPEDYLLVLSWAFYVAFLSFVYEQAVVNGGRHQWNVRLGDLPHTLFLEWASTIMYALMICFAKWSLLLLMQRVFSVARKDTTWWIIQTLILANIIFWAGAVVAQMFLCIPIEKIWKQFEIEGQCSDPNVVFILTAAWNLTMDVLILIIPMTMIPRLQIAKNLKGRLIAVFMLGGCACIASAFRIWFSVQLIYTDDRTYTIVQTIWSASLEHMGVIIVICSTSFIKLWRHFRHQPSSNIMGSRSQKTNSVAITNRLGEQHRWIELQRGTSSGLAKTWPSQVDEAGDEDEESDHGLSAIGRALPIPSPNEHEQRIPIQRPATIMTTASRHSVNSAPLWHEHTTPMSAPITPVTSGPTTMGYTSNQRGRSAPRERDEEDRVMDFDIFAGNDRGYFDNQAWVDRRARSQTWFTDTSGKD